MKIYYDFHIHTALSPCGDNDMTPCNIVQMAILKGLDVIAVTDHNTTMNCRAVIEASKRLNGPLVIAGMELTTSEEIHAVILFNDIDSAENCEKEIKEKRVKIKNKKEIFGAQLLFDSNDNIVSEEENLLINASLISIENVRELALKYNGVSFPAHVDKPSNGILAILGAIDKELGFHTVEVSRNYSEKTMKGTGLNQYLILKDSDAHFLEDISEKDTNILEVDSLSENAIIEAVKNGKINNFNK